MGSLRLIGSGASRGKTDIGKQTVGSFREGKQLEAVKEVRENRVGVGSGGGTN